MKNLIKLAAAVLALFCATACATASEKANGPGVDITAFVREHGAYTVEAGSYTGGLNSNSLANIFDGITNTTDEARALLHNTQNPSSTTSTPVRVLYTISDSSLPGYEFEVTSFTMYRVTGQTPLSAALRNSNLKVGTEASGRPFLRQARRRCGIGVSMRVPLQSLPQIAGAIASTFSR